MRRARPAEPTLPSLPIVLRTDAFRYPRATRNGRCYGLATSANRSWKTLCDHGEFDTVARADGLVSHRELLDQRDDTGGLALSFC